MENLVCLFCCGAFLQTFLYVQSYVGKFIQHCRASPVTDETPCFLQPIKIFLFCLRIDIKGK